MKKLILLIILLIPIKVMGISAESAVVMDSNSGRVLYCHNCDKQKLIASTTKIMTSIIAIEYGDLNKRIKAGEEILKAYGSAIYMQVDEELSLKELLYGLMLRSGNDAAIEIAYGVTGSMESFVYLMNAKARSLGMDNTIFYNNHGLEENNGKGNTSTARDMAKLMSYAMNNEVFKEITSTKSITIKSNYKTYVWKNKNRLLNSYEYTTGGKTGFTEKARRTLVTSASKDGKDLVVVTLNDGNDFQDHKDLYEEYFKKYKEVVVLRKDNFKIDSDNFKDGEVYINNDYRVLVLDEEKDKIRIDIELIKRDKYQEGDKVGKAKVVIDEEVIYEEDIFYKEIEEKESKVKKKSIWKILWEFIKFW